MGHLAFQDDKFVFSEEDEEAMSNWASAEVERLVYHEGDHAPAPSDPHGGASSAANAVLVGATNAARFAELASSDEEGSDGGGSEFSLLSAEQPWVERFDDAKKSAREYLDDLQWVVVDRAMNHGAAFAVLDAVFGKAVCGVVEIQVGFFLQVAVLDNRSMYQ